MILKTQTRLFFLSYCIGFGIYNLPHCFVPPIYIFIIVVSDISYRWHLMLQWPCHQYTLIAFCNTMSPLHSTNLRILIRDT